MCSATGGSKISIHVAEAEPATAADGTMLRHHMLQSARQLFHYFSTVHQVNGDSYNTPVQTPCGTQVQQQHESTQSQKYMYTR